MRSLLLAATAACAAAGKKKYDTSFKGFKDDVLNIHLIAHTHDDVGWLKTVDQYYLGANNTIQHAGVQYILDSLIPALLANPDRKFIYVEQAYFQRWWAEQDDDMQATVKQLVQEGRLEFINGGWSMHDEATPSWVDMADNTALGHRLIYEQFGVLPTVTWQIDPFGHSATQATLLSSPKAGFHGLFFGRADYQDIAHREATQNMEMLWAPSAALGEAAMTFTGINYNLYQPPDGFCWDIGCDDAQPINDDPNLYDNNVEYMAEKFLNATLYDQALHYAGNHILMTMGSDFQYEQADEIFKNQDKLVHYMNSIYGDKVNVFYSTPSIYLKAKLTALAGKMQTKTDDFFPYADSAHAYWTGYFTSRPAIKGYVRESSSFHQAARQLQFMTGGVKDLSPSNPLYLLERAMGVTQHHDAVSGTEKQHVAYDYAKRLAAGRLAADPMVAAAAATLTNDKAAAFAGCDLLNVTVCPSLESGKPTMVFLHNPQAQARELMPVMLPVGFPAGVASYNVYDDTGSPVTAQLLPLSDEDVALRTLYKGNPGVSIQWLAFQAATPAIGFATYFITPASSLEEAPATHASSIETFVPGPAAADKIVSSGSVSLLISGTTGMVSQIASKSPSGKVTKASLTQDWVWYNSSTGPDFSQPSGAYIFRPNSSIPTPVSHGPASVTVIYGPVIQEARQSVGAWVSQVTRMWANATFAEVQFTVGPIDISDFNGKEVVTRYNVSGWATAATWETDSNGRDFMTRVRNYRQTWNLTVEEPVAGNYVPVNFGIRTTDTRTGNVLSIATDRTQGGASMADGSLELMVHRRLLVDDYRGVGEPLNEPGLDGKGLIIRGVHRLAVDPSSFAGQNLRTSMQDLTLRPLLQFAPLTAPTVADWLAKHTATASALAAPLPANVQVTTLHSRAPGSTLLRLAHLYQPNEDAVLGKPATVDIASLFVGQNIKSVVEYSLTGVVPLTEVPPVTYTMADGSTVTLPVLPPAPSGPGYTITIDPMDVRTFVVTTEA